MFSAGKWVHADGRKQEYKPAEEPAGVIAIAEAIPTMGALTSLDMSSNNFGGWNQANQAVGSLGNYYQTNSQANQALMALRSSQFFA